MDLAEIEFVVSLFLNYATSQPPPLHTCARAGGRPKLKISEDDCKGFFSKGGLSFASNPCMQGGRREGLEIAPQTTQHAERKGEKSGVFLLVFVCRSLLAFARGGGSVFETDCCTSFIRPPIPPRSPILSREEEVISDIADTFFVGPVLTLRLRRRLRVENMKAGGIRRRIVV